MMLRVEYNHFTRVFPLLGRCRHIVDYLISQQVGYRIIEGPRWEPIEIQPKPLEYLSTSFTLDKGFQVFQNV